MTDQNSESTAPGAGLRLGGFDQSLGVRLISGSADEVVLAYDIDARHHQPYGIVHGGVHCAVVESACSLGASLSARSRGQAGAVGLDNHTSFIRAVRGGTVTVTAKPLTRGRRTQLWEATARTEAGEIISTGRVRLLCLESGTELDGEKLER